MKTCYISLVPNAPPGFEFKKPVKRDLLSGRIALYAASAEDCLSLLDKFSERVSGLVITEGTAFAYHALGPQLWHLETDENIRSSLHELASFFLEQIERSRWLLENNQAQSIELNRCKRDYHQIRDEYSNHAGSLVNKVQQLREEVQRRKEIEQQLTVFKQFAENSNQGIGWIDPQGKIIYVNPTLSKLMGFRAPEDVIGKDVFQFYPKSEQENIRSTILPQIMSTGSWSGEQTLLQAGTGELIPSFKSAFLIRNEQEEAAYVAYFIVDLREQKKTEQELLKVKKLESVGFLAGGIAHDFNNLLAAILGNLELVAMSNHPESDHRRLLDQAIKASIRARSLTQQLLTFSKGGEPIRKAAQVDAIIMESASFILHGHAVACHYDIPGNLRKIEADPGQISQVIQNLIINACHAMPDGGEIRIACTNVDDPPSAQPPIENPVRIAISDDGCGIPAEDLDKIFDPYFSTKEGGSGLGLAICHSVITKHGGTISVQSKPGVGTTFTIDLPGIPDSNPEPSPDDQPDARPMQNQEGRKLRFLIMDDEHMLRTISQRLLTRLGHEAVVAKDGEEAIEIYREHQTAGRPIDITIMDLTIPGGMGGKEAVAEIRKLDPDAIVIVSSGYSGDPVMANYREHGFSAAIAKPFEVADFRALIDSLTT